MKLVAYINDQRCGVFGDSGGYRFTYDEAWARSPEGHPVSFSLPTVPLKHAGRSVEAYLRSLLPESDLTLRALGNRFSCNHRRPLEIARPYRQ